MDCKLHFTESKYHICSARCRMADLGRRATISMRCPSGGAKSRGAMCAAIGSSAKVVILYTSSTPRLAHVAWCLATSGGDRAPDGETML